MGEYRPSPLFLKRLGRLDFVVEQTPDGAETNSSRPPFQWKQLPTTGVAEPVIDVHLPVDYAQPSLLELQLVFQPHVEDVYDVQWIVGAGEDVQLGERIVHAYRITDGTRFVQYAPFAITVLESLVARNRKVVRGDALVRCAVPPLVLDLTKLQLEFRQMQFDVVQAVNAAFEGYLARLGRGEGIVSRVDPVAVVLQPELGYASLCDQIVAGVADEVVEGDIVVVSATAIAVAQGRVFPIELLQRWDPKTSDREDRADLLTAARHAVPELTLEDLLYSSSFQGATAPIATGGIADPNTITHDIAAKVLEKTGRHCDVLISTPDTGLEVRETLINCFTVGATPLGATAGLVIYECMAIANAVEGVRTGGDERIILCRPHARRIRRTGIGEFRGYSGHLNATKERLLGYA